MQVFSERHRSAKTDYTMVPHTIRKVSAGSKNRPSPYEKLEVRDLQVLLAVAEASSFRKASKNLLMGQSAVTRRIQKIEDSLGVSMFERSPVGARLTNVGWRFTEHARRLMEEIHAAIDMAQMAGTADSGQLHVGLIASLSCGAFRNVVTSFLHNHSDVDVKFTESDRSDLLTLLSHRIIDVVFAAGCEVSPFGDTLVLTEEPIYFAMPQNHNQADRDHVAWSDVANECFVVSTSEPGPEIKDYIVRKVSGLGRKANVHQHQLDREGIMNLVSLGLGISLVAQHWTGVKYPNVTFRQVGNDERIPFSLTWHPENDNPTLRRFLSLARLYVKAHAAPS